MNTDTQAIWMKVISVFLGRLRRRGVVNGEPMRGLHGNAGEFASVIPSDGFQPNLTQLLTMMREIGDSLASLGAMLAAFPEDDPVVDRWLDAAEAPLNLVISAISGVLC